MCTCRICSIPRPLRFAIYKEVLNVSFAAVGMPVSEKVMSGPANSTDNIGTLPIIDSDMLKFQNVVAFLSFFSPDSVWRIAMQSDAYPAANDVWCSSLKMVAGFNSMIDSCACIPHIQRARAGSQAAW